MTMLLTPCLTLRPPCAADAAAIVRELGNFSVSRWTGRVPHPYGPADAEAFLAHCRQLPAGALVLAVTRDDALIGVIGVEQGELGYWLAESAWGMGYGKEAAQAMVDRSRCLEGDIRDYYEEVSISTAGSCACGVSLDRQAGTPLYNF